MREFLVAIAPLACPVGMGLMLWMMMRGNHSGTEAERPEVAQLRAEIAELKAARVWFPRDRGGFLMPLPA
ncbi:hypothetical protein [Mycolicibacterium phocaicum]|uniref:Uncharacterized protein n=1 Tax=Mycolicibacterium phocaicum TaxID=319706 RepID=A0A7I7ZUQ3_9MYCO|nr:hypothetical protein [Mycolicibacterium phocaicum]TLH63684.1 hypothetical protein C1S79_21155 [Mycolicibacterium phocaicum]BBZ53740.1 hypothetical protein MPHO_07320 [Mycolicibacterium phocaicum]BBZ57996.1 hypothetical protein MPHO_49880 [Mycolicibacterium phocaicum]